MSKMVPLVLADGSGGLNTRDPKSGILKNEFSKLENYQNDEGAYLRKRPGSKLIQYAPIDPQVFVADADTLGLWHLDEAASPFLDSSGNGFSLTPGAGGVTARANGLFPIAAGFGIQAIQAAVDGSADGGFISRGINGASIAVELAQSTFEIWINIPATFSGKPQDSAGNAFSNNGAYLLAMVDDTSYPVSGIINGLRIYRDWDATAGKDASDPYVTFTLRTTGTGVDTTIRSGYLPTSRWLHIRGTYNSITGKMRLWVNGSLESEATPNGGGNMAGVSGAAATVFIGGALNNNASSINSVFTGICDEARISSVDRGEAFPFKNPRGEEMVLEKADGTRQLVVAADEGLYYTVADGNWSLIKSLNTTDAVTFDPANSLPISSAADWSGVQIADRLYMTNGINTPLTWDGSRVVPTGEGVIPITLSMAASGNTNNNGVHKFTYAYKYGSDYTGFAPIAQITVTGKDDVNLGNIPTRHDNCDSILIFKTKAGASAWFLDREVANNPNVNFFSLSGPWVDNNDPALDTGASGTPDADLGAGLYLAVASVDSRLSATAIRKNKYYLAEHNRLFACGSPDFPYDLTWSALGNPDVFRALAFVVVSGDKGPLVGMASDHGEIVLSKNANATSVLRGTDESNWTLTENIHPGVGARDHWSFVQRYPFVNGQESGDYTLQFVATDGIYEYNAGRIRCITDKIGPTFRALAVSTSTRQDWVTTDQADFQQAAANGGAAGANVQQGKYETDGMRVSPGDVQIIDQLDYLGLWSNAASLVTGKVTSVVKGAAEGEFYFATDSVAQQVYRTTDNFASLAVLQPPVIGSATEFIIEIVYASISSRDNLFVFTSDTGAGGVGKLYRILDPVGAAGIGPLVTELNSGLYWQSDTLCQFNSNAVAAQVSTPVPSSQLIDSGNLNSDGFLGTTILDEFNSKSVHFIGDPFVTPATVFDFQVGGITASNNIRINHQQNIFLDPNDTDSRLSILLAQSISGEATSKIQNDASAGYSVAVASGFYSIRDSTSYLKRPVSDRVRFTYESSGGFRVKFTTRETAQWQGGTFRPQAFFAANKLWYLAAGAEDANGNRNTTLYSQLVTTATAITTVTSNIAMANDGTNIWLVDNTPDTSGGFGFVPRLRKVVMSTEAISTIGDLPGAINYLFTKLSYNANSGRLLGCGKYFGVSTRNSYQFKGFLVSFATNATNIAFLKTFTDNNDAGAFPQELAYQTVTPFAFFAAMQNIQSGELSAMYKVLKEAASDLDVSAYKSSAYTGLSASAAVNGCLSNLIFVASSSLSGNYLWSDRLYWFANAATATDARMLQLGVPGTWTVKGGLTSRANELGIFSAFGNLDVDYEGDIAFFFRNASTAGGLAATEKQVTPNQAIQGFSPVAIWAQWRVLLTWDYTVANPTVSPILSVVDVAYFLGSSTVPRPVAAHWLGRTYFALAEDGEDENNIVLVYGKRNSWMIYRGWRLKAMRKFRNMFTAFQDYQFIQLEEGFTDLGNIIRGVGRTGVLAGGGKIVAIDDGMANIEGTVSADFPTKSGWVKLNTYAGETLGSYPKMIELHPSAERELLVSHLTPLSDFGWDWAEAGSFEIKTSDETSGAYVPSVDQQEIIQQVELNLLTEDVGREYTGK